MRQKGIASGGQIYRSSVLSERAKCPKCTGVRTEPDFRKEHIANREQIMYSAVYRPLRGPAVGLAFAAVSERLGVRCRYPESRP